jgi:hypothetical protein
MNGFVLRNTFINICVCYFFNKYLYKKVKVVLWRLDRCLFTNTSCTRWSKIARALWKLAHMLFLAKTSTICKQQVPSLIDFVWTERERRNWRPWTLYLYSTAPLLGSEDETRQMATFSWRRGGPARVFLVAATRYPFIFILVPMARVDRFPLGPRSGSPDGGKGN